MADIDPSLLDRWPLPGALQLRDDLLEAYADPRREYHDVRHLTEVLERIDELLDADDPGVDGTAVRLAAWFHDAVYDARPGAEERSAQWAERTLPDAGVTADRTAEIVRLVRLTEHHRPSDDDVAGAVLSDADLGILAAGPERYADYTASVRREYADVPDDAFAAGRASILRGLLGAPSLFHTAYAREHWEGRARANVTAEVERLTTTP
ncbi:hypothetical protein [Nocardioides sp.]|uniref:HD domain-containing protein n=1 Tax=Nocardioides sp. TaxID=35761 RepID=UPI0027338319|nr:hypothetical protein [Nocardioides sp.]MDP3891283.1 hypothetical protein [Nocardioides sp.]